MRIWAISDVHVDFAANAELVESIPVGPHRTDGLVLAGDLSHRLDRAERALGALAERFGQVFFVAGNHDLWVDGGELAGAPVESSLDRLEALWAVCERLGVHTRAAAAGPHWWALPLHGWYEAGFGAVVEADQTRPPIPRGWADHWRCRWPAGLGDDGARSRHFAALNQADLDPPAGRRVLTFSHFVPRPELLPPPARLRFPGLPGVAGTLRLEAQLRAARSCVHVFGHSHTPWDQDIDGVRYASAPLGYPRERARRGQPGMALKRIA